MLVFGCLLSGHFFHCWNVCWLAGSWMLVSRSLILSIIVNMWTDSPIFGAQHLSFGWPGAPILGYRGGPWNQQEGHVGVWHRFGDDFGDHFESFLGTEGSNAMFVSCLFPGHFLHRFVSVNLLACGSQNKDLV